MDIDEEEITMFIKENWKNQLSFPLEFEETISNFGSDNVVFQTSEQDKFIFRIIYSHPDVIHNGSQIYEKLSEMNLPVPVPLKTDDGYYVLDAWDEELERMIGYSIHSFVEGQEEDDKSNLASVLEGMALWFGKLHAGLSLIEMQEFDLMGITADEITEQYNNAEVGFSDDLLEYPPENPLVRDMLSFWMDWRDDIDFSKLTKGLIHGDMGPGANILIKNGKVTGLIDFIEVGFGYYLQDVASFIMYGGLYQEENRDLLELFKKTYMKHSPISDHELELIPFFLLWRFLIQALYFDWRLRIDYTQGTDGEGNQKGYQDALWFLGFWKDHFEHLM